MQQTGQRDLEFRKAQLMEGANQDRVLMELERRRQLLPQILQIGGTSAGSGMTSGWRQVTLCNNQIK